jgi:hypothetical protein
MMLEIRSRARIEEAERGAIYFILLLIREFRLERRLEVFSDCSPDFEASVLEKLVGAGDRTGERSFPARNSRPLSLSKDRRSMRSWEGSDMHNLDCSKWDGTMIIVLVRKRLGLSCYVSPCRILMFKSDNCNIYILFKPEKKITASHDIGYESIGQSKWEVATK